MLIAEIEMTMKQMMCCRHKNVQIRNVAAHLIKCLVENAGCDRVLVEFPDKILPVAAKFLTDGSPQVRYAACTVSNQNSVIWLVV